MKKISILFVGLAMVAFVSCKKDYTCECTYTFAGVSSTVEYEYKDVKKKDAEDSCEAVNSSYYSCEIK